MKMFTGIMCFVLAMPIWAFSSKNIPASLMGEWVVGTPYSTPGPVGITASQEKFVRTLHIDYATDRYRVCGKSMVALSVGKKSLTDDEFLQAYGFLSGVIGMKSMPITDVTINPQGGMYACGEYNDPGSHALIDGSGHVVIEVANDYFPLERG